MPALVFLGFPDNPEEADGFYGEGWVPKGIGVKHPGCWGETYAATSEAREPFIAYGSEPFPTLNRAVKLDKDGG